jgi:hypothetical protein
MLAALAFVAPYLQFDLGHIPHLTLWEYTVKYIIKKVRYLLTLYPLSIYLIGI